MAKRPSHAKLATREQRLTWRPFRMLPLDELQAERSFWKHIAMNPGQPMAARVTAHRHMERCTTFIGIACSNASSSSRLTNDGRS